MQPIEIIKTIKGDYCLSLLGVSAGYFQDKVEIIKFLRVKLSCPTQSGKFINKPSLKDTVDYVNSIWPS